MKSWPIFCDAYGSYVSALQCKKCILKCDCVKLKLSHSGDMSLKINNIRSF
jgi:hypothetical protein